MKLELPDLRADAAPGLLTTPAPFEHYDAGRSQVFPFSCTLRELTGDVYFGEKGMRTTAAGRRLSPSRLPP